MRSFAIHIYTNPEANKAKVDDICVKNGVKIGPLFEAIVDNMTEEEWAKYASFAKAKKGMTKGRRADIAKQLSALDDDKLETLMAALRAQGINIEEET